MGRLDNKSRMNREIHVRIREGVGVRLHLRYSTPQNSGKQI